MVCETEFLLLGLLVVHLAELVALCFHICLMSIQFVSLGLYLVVRHLSVYLLF